jgi:hypothetical protein
MVLEIQKGVLVALRTGRLKDAGRLRPEQISFGKFSNVRQAIAICRTARTILGANGTTLDRPPLRHPANLESVRTYEGTDEVYTLWVPNTVSPRATWVYSRIKRPSRSRRSTRILASSTGGCAPGRRRLVQRTVRPVGVVVIGVLAEDQPQVPCAGVRSRQARRARAIQRSATVFARGAWTGVVMTRIAAAASAASNAAVNVASRIKNVTLSAWSWRFISRLRACCGTRCPSGGW